MFGTALDHVQQLLKAGGVRAVINPADINPPAVWITPATSSLEYLDDTTATVTLDLYLVAAAAGGRSTVTALDALLGKVRAAGLPARDVESVTVALPNHNPAGMPAYKTTATMQTQETQP